ncbi:hypothetical protein MACH05_24620 [Qipengyuania nanhaisediminis]
MRGAFPLLAAFALAACGSEPATNAPEPAPVETAIPVEPDGGIGDGAGPPDRLDTALANRIPTRFHGVWDHVEGSCDAASDLRMEISGNEILFYESIGTVTGAAPDGDAVIVTLAMEGEGETWEQKTRLALVGEGESQRLETSDGDLPRTPDDYPSKRCPA